jgi:hypothetical protein
VRADVPWDAGGSGDALHHPVDVAPVDRLAAGRPKDERAGGALAAAGLQDAQDGDGQRHGGGLVALADQVQHPVPAEGVGVVPDLHAAASEARSALIPNR